MSQHSLKAAPAVAVDVLADSVDLVAVFFGVFYVAYFFVADVFCDVFAYASSVFFSVVVFVAFDIVSS